MQRFGQVEFGGAHGRLTVAGKDVKIDRACRAILAVLVDEAGYDVSKDRLLEAGWPGRLVDENSLAKAVSRLRQALGDEGEVLQTVHGHGYRLATEVERFEPAPESSSRGIRLLWAAAAALVVLGAVALALLTGVGSNPPNVRNGEAPDALGRVLWVDDHPQNNAVETRYLEDRRIAVYHVASTEEALTLLSMYEYGAVISDMGRGKRPLAGIDLLEAMRARGDRRPFVLYTVHSSDSQRKLVEQAGGHAVAETREQLYRAILPLFGADEPR